MKFFQRLATVELHFGIVLFNEPARVGASSHLRVSPPQFNVMLQTVGIDLDGLFKTLYRCFILLLGILP